MKKRAALVRSKFLLPLLIFAAIAVFFALGLRLDSTRVPSPLVGQAAPGFELPLLHLSQASFSPLQMRGEHWILNVWASWCVACIEEHDELIALADAGLRIVGLNYKDAPQDAKDWLRQRGNPYLVVAVDAHGSAAIDWGVYGVPETFVIDDQGVIVYKHIGPITEEIVATEILPLLEKS